MTLSTLCRSLQSLVLASKHDCQLQFFRTVRHYTSSTQSATVPRTLHTPHSDRLLDHRIQTPSLSATTHSQLHTSSVMCKFRPWKNTPKYTVKPMGLKRFAGRNNTGRITVTGRGGGHKRRYRMIDFNRTGPETSEPFTEKVLFVRHDPCRTAKIAMVAGGNQKRWILATVNMQSGDILRTSGAIGRMTVAANEGDAYPLGALPIGSLVHSVEVMEGEGGRYARAAGTSAQLLRKTGGQVILQLPSKQQISVSERCMATVGRVSNENHNKTPIGKAGRNRWLGWRPSSGLWQRKGGWAGRKIKPIPPIKVFQSPNNKGTHVEL